MQKVTKDNLFLLASHVRKVIEASRNFHITEMDHGFSDFPTARCDVTSEILKRYLEELDVRGFEFIKKEGRTIDGYPYTHVWIENDVFSIDLTASQYNAIWEGINFPEVIVVEKFAYYFNTQPGEFQVYIPDAFNPPAPGLGYSDFEEFYLKYLCKK